MVNSFIRAQRPRLRDDGRAQRVREHARTTRRSCCAAGCSPSAYQWHNYGHIADRRALGHRERRHRPPAGVLQAVLPAGQRGADRGRQVRSGADARARSRSTSGRSRSRRARCRASTRRSRCRTASARPRCAASATRKFRRHDVPHRARRAPGLRRDRRARRRDDARAVGTAVQGAGRDQEGFRRAGVDVGARRIRACSPFSRRFPTASRSSRRATRCSRRSPTSPRSRSPKPKSRACAPAPRSTSTTRSPTRRQFGVAISESIALGDWRLFFIQRDQYRAVKPADVQRVALDYLKRSNLTIGEFLPEAKPDRAPTPPTVDVAAMVKDYKGDAATATGEAFDPTPANLDARTQRFTLANGMKVALLPKKTRGEAVSFNVSLHFGDEKSVFGKASTGTIAGSMLMRGTTKRSRQEIEDAFDKLRAKVARLGHAGRAPAHPARPIAKELPEVLKLDGGSAARAVVPGDRARPAQARSAPRSSKRRAPIRRRSRRARSRGTPIRIPQATRATRPRSRKASPATTPSRSTTSSASTADFYGASQRRAVDRGRFRRRGDARARDAAFRRLEESVAVYARPRSVPAEPAGGAAHRRAGQGQRVPARRASAFPLNDLNPDYPALLVDELHPRRFVVGAHSRSAAAEGRAVVQRGHGLPAERDRRQQRDRRPTRSSRPRISRACVRASRRSSTAR